VIPSLHRFLTQSRSPVLLAHYESGQILLANSAAVLLYEYELEEWKGYTVFDLFLTEDVERFRTALEGGRSPYSVIKTGTWTHRTKSGRTLEVDIAACRARETSGEVLLCRIVNVTPKREEVVSPHAPHQLLQRTEKRLEEERKRIARDLHDGLGQELTAMRFRLKALERAVMDTAEDLDSVSPVVRRIMELHRGLDTLIDQTHQIVHDLRPAMLDDFGLAVAIETLASEFQRTTRIRVKVTATGELDVPDEDRRIALFRICQEALTNVGRHSGASQADVALHITRSHARLRVSDNGKGIRRSQLVSGTALGIAGMRERVRVYNGMLEIKGTPRSGTTVDVKIPMESEVDALSNGVNGRGTLLFNDAHLRQTQRGSRDD